MADWQFPTGAYKAYVPGGRFGRGIGRGLGRFAEGLGQWTNQILAIKQYEAEKEEKRRQELQRRAETQMQAALAPRIEEQERIAEDYIKEADLQRELRKMKIEHEYRMMEKPPKEKEKWQSEVDAVYKALGGVQTERGGRFAQDLINAFESGNLDPVAQVGTSVAAYPELSWGLTGTQIDVEGRPKKTYGQIKDASILREASRKFMQLGRIKGYKYTGQPVQLGETTTMYADVRKRLEAVIGGSEAEMSIVVSELLSEGKPPMLIQAIIGELERE